MSAVALAPRRALGRHGGVPMNSSEALVLKLVSNLSLRFRLNNEHSSYREPFV